MKFLKVIFALLCAVAVSACAAQSAQTSAPQSGSADAAQSSAPAEPVTMFPHPDSAPYLLSGQANIIFQAHPGFHSPYDGTNSMLARGEYKVSMVGTLFTGFELNKNPRYDTDVIFDL